MKCREAVVLAVLCGLKGDPPSIPNTVMSKEHIRGWTGTYKPDDVGNFDKEFKKLIEKNFLLKCKQSKEFKKYSNTDEWYFPTFETALISKNIMQYIKGFESLNELKRWWQDQKIVLAYHMRGDWMKYGACETGSGPGRDWVLCRPDKSCQCF